MNYDPDDVKQIKLATDREAIRKIESWWLRMEKKKEGKALRIQLARLPYPCRRSCVKMFDLKQNTKLFKNQADKFQRSNVLF